ncbi:YdiU family protein [Halobacillus shinanisalinarum]|uniref:Protein nucleotidyltransferase YdiU n=1 Tax=Halobacillus shinanisalinarum TaxID=2932258 RepID=A0ABY4H5L1_9BACI|nr:YdiU family protein [Halobacillus shinanisalinarum]UOQ95723.1 YdiU family protein [Halobacillus shinanisalinarum]
MAQIKEIGWNFDNSYASLPELFFKNIEPTPVRSAELVILNKSLANSLGLDVKKLQSKEGIEVVTGNQIPEGALPIAQAYAGHQFGNFTMLGDGRAVLLGEQITPSGERFDIQLKGSGRTPFSRRGDGRATLGPMLREYIISESMHALNIPTNRSLSVVTTGESVIRETELPGAILTRVAASHLRIGTFEYAANGGTVEDLRALTDYAIERHFPDIEDNEDRYLSLFQEVIKRQAALIAKWQLVGFIHGVMNTDNMTISGETIDYGPCAFMDEYNPATVFSSIDVQGRYAYQNQPPIGQWNLARFAEALLPLFHEDQDHAVELAEEALAKFEKLYHSYWLKGMRRKLGIQNEEEQDEPLIEDLLGIMENYRADFTNTFRALTLGEPEDTVMNGTTEFTHWYEQWQARLDRQEESKTSAYQVMKNTNPAVIPRNHRVEEALEAAVEKADYSVMERLMDVLSNPYAYSSEQEEYTKLAEPSNRPYRTFCGT